MAEELRIRIKVDDGGSLAVIDRAGKELGKLKTEGESAARGIREFDVAVDRASRSANPFAQAMGGVTAGLKAIGSGIVVANQALQLFGSVARNAEAAVGALMAGVTRAASLYDLGQKIGVSATEISRFDLAARAAGVSMESFGTGFKFLSRNMGEARGGTGEAAAAFKALGIAVVDSNGQLRKSSDVMLELSDRFANAKDGPEKTALALKLLGRSGSEMIPFLNQGRGEIERLTQSAEKLGLVLSNETLAAADRFDDAMTTLGAAVDGVRAQLAAGMAPALARAAERLVEFAEQAGIADGRVSNLGAALGAAFEGLANRAVDALDEIAGAIERSGGDFGAAFEVLKPQIVAAGSAMLIEVGKTLGEITLNVVVGAIKGAFAGPDIAAIVKAGTRSQVEEAYKSEVARFNSIAVKGLDLSQQDLSVRTIAENITGLQGRLSALSQGARGVIEPIDRAARNAVGGMTQLDGTMISAASGATALGAALDKPKTTLPGVKTGADAAADATKKLAAELTKLDTTGAIWQRAASGATTVAAATIQAAAAQKLASTEGITAAQAMAAAQKEAANATLQQSAATRQSADDIALSNSAFSEAISAGQSYEEATRTATAAVEDAAIVRAAETAGISDQIPLLLANAEAKRKNTEAGRALQAETKYNEDVADLEREVGVWTRVRDGVIGVKQAQHELAVEQAKSALLAQGFPGDIDAAAERMVSLKEHAEELKGSFLDLGDILRDAFSQTFDAIVAGTRDLSDAFKGIGISIGKQLFEATLKEKFKFDKTFEGNIFNLGNLVTDVLGGSFEGVFSLAGALFGSDVGGGGGSGAGSWLNLLLGSGGGGGGGGGLGSGGSILQTLLGGGGGGGSSAGLLSLVLPALIGGGQAGAAGSSQLGGALGAAGTVALLSWLSGGGGASVLGPLASSVGLSAAPLYNGAADLFALQGSTFGGQATQGITNIYNGVSFFSNGVSPGTLLAGAGGAVGGIAGGYLGGKAAGSLGFVPETTTGQVISGVVNGVGAIGGGIAAAAAGAAAASSAAAAGAAGGLAAAAGVLAATVVGLVIAVIVAIIAAILGSLANPTTTQGTLERRALEGVLDGTKTFKDLQGKLGDIRRTAYVSTDAGTQTGIERLGESGALSSTRGFGGVLSAVAGFEGNSLANQAEQQGNILTEFFGRIEDTSKATGKSIKESLLEAFKDMGVTAPKAMESLNKVADAFFVTAQNLGPAWYEATRTDQLRLFGEELRGTAEIFQTEMPAGVNVAQVALESMGKDGAQLFVDLNQSQKEFLNEVARSPELFDEYVGRLARDGYRIDVEKFEADLRHIAGSAAVVGPQIGKAIFSSLDPSAAAASIAESVQQDIITKSQDQITNKFLESTDIAGTFKDAYAVLDQLKDVDIFDPEQVKEWGGNLQAAVADGSARLQEYLPAIREIQEAFRQAFNADTVEAARVRVAEFAAQAASSLASIVANVWTAGAQTGGKGMAEAFVAGVKQYLATQEGNIVGALFADPNGELAVGMAELNEKWHQIVADGKITPEEMFDYAQMREKFLNEAEAYGDALEKAGTRAAQESGRAWRDSVAAYEKEVQGIVGNAVSAGFQVLNNGGSVQSAMEAFQASFRQGVQQAVVGAIVEALVQSAIIEGALAPFFALLKTYATAALQDGVITPLEQQGLNFLTDTILTKGAQLLQQLEPTIRSIFENGVGDGTAAGLQRGINTPVNSASGGTTPAPSWSPGPGGWTPAAANGGTFRTGAAVVGEAGPELAETIPGGGFRITPISWHQASQLTGLSLPAYGGGGSCGPGGCSGSTKPACCSSCAGGGPCAGKLPGLACGGTVYPGAACPSVPTEPDLVNDRNWGCPTFLGYKDGGRRASDGHVMCRSDNLKAWVDFGPNPVWHAEENDYRGSQDPKNLRSARGFGMFVDGHGWIRPNPGGTSMLNAADNSGYFAGGRSRNHVGANSPYDIARQSWILWSLEHLYNGPQPENNLSYLTATPRTWPEFDSQLEADAPTFVKSMKQKLRVAGRGRYVDPGYYAWRYSPEAVNYFRTEREMYAEAVGGVEIGKLEKFDKFNAAVQAYMTKVMAENGMGTYPAFGGDYYKPGPFASGKVAWKSGQALGANNGGTTTTGTPGATGTTGGTGTWSGGGFTPSEAYSTSSALDAAARVFGFGTGSYSPPRPVTTPDPGGGGGGTTPTCPEGQKAENGVCVSACTGATPFWDSYRKTCAACPPGQEQAPGGGCRTPICPRGSTWDLSKGQCVSGGTGEPPPTTTNPSPKCAAQPRGYYTPDWQECASCGPTWGYDPDTNFCYPGRGGGATNDAPCRAANNGNAVQIWQVIDPDTGQRLDPSKFPAYHRACDRCGWVWSDSTDDGLHPVCSPPRGAATGGVFTTGSAIVGEAGMPERVDPLPGGGFRVTPLSWEQARAELGSLPGLATGGTVIGGGTGGTTGAFLSAFLSEQLSQVSDDLAKALRTGFEESAPYVALRQKITTELDAAFAQAQAGTMTPEKAQAIAERLTATSLKMREEAEKLAPILAAIAKDQALNIQLSFDDALRTVAQGGSPEAVATSIGDAVRGQVLDALISALVAEGPLKTAIDMASSVVGETMHAAMADGILSDEDVKRIADAGKGAATMVRGALTAVRPAIDAIREGLGAVLEDTSARISQLFGNAISQAFTQAEGIPAFLKAIKTSIFENVRNGLIDAFMQSSIVKAALEPLISGFDGLFDRLKKKELDLLGFKAEATLLVDEALGKLTSDEFKTAIEGMRSVIEALSARLGVIPYQIDQTSTSIRDAANAVTDSCGADCELQYRLARLSIGKELLDAAGRQGIVDLEQYVPLPPKAAGGSGSGSATNPNAKYTLIPEAEYRSMHPNASYSTNGDGQVEVISQAWRMWQRQHGLPEYGIGGIAWSSQVARIAEREPEIIVPLSKLGGSRTERDSSDARFDRLESAIMKLAEAISQQPVRASVSIDGRELATALSNTGRVAARGRARLLPADAVA